MTDRARVVVEELRLRNFRAFENARLELSDLTFLVGRNGAGKSSLLDAVAFLQEAVTGSLENALDRRGGLAAVTRLAAREGGARPCLGVALVMSVSITERKEVRALYGFELTARPMAANVVTGDSSLYTIVEQLRTDSAQSGFERHDDEFKAPGQKLEASPPPGNLVLPLVGRSDSLWQLVLEGLRGLRTYELSPAHMAVASEIGERSSLLPNGANAGDVVKALSESDRNWVVQRLDAITEGIRDVSADAVLGRRVLTFMQQQEERARRFDASQVSQGTLRGLGVLLALRQRPVPTLVLVDEIESSVHPSALAVLVDAALASCEQTRVVLTSHSTELLGHPAVTGDRVRVIEWRQGKSHVFRLNEQTRQAVNEIDTVGWMLSSNAIWTGEQPCELGSCLFDLDRPDA